MGFRNARPRERPSLRGKSREWATHSPPARGAPSRSAGQCPGCPAGHLDDPGRDTRKGLLEDAGDGGLADKSPDGARATEDGGQQKQQEASKGGNAAVHEDEVQGVDQHGAACQDDVQKQLQLQRQRGSLEDEAEEEGLQVHLHDAVGQVARQVDVDLGLDPVPEALHVLLSVEVYGQCGHLQDLACGHEHGPIHERCQVVHRVHDLHVLTGKPFTRLSQLLIQLAPQEHHVPKLYDDGASYEGDLREPGDAEPVNETSPRTVALEEFGEGPVDGRVAVGDVAHELSPREPREGVHQAHDRHHAVAVAALQLRQQPQQGAALHLGLAQENRDVVQHQGLDQNGQRWDGEAERGRALRALAPEAAQVPAPEGQPPDGEPRWEDRTVELPKARNGIGLHHLRGLLGVVLAPIVGGRLGVFQLHGMRGDRRDIRSGEKGIVHVLVLCVGLGVLAEGLHHFADLLLAHTAQARKARPR
mmetsp:Transcript_40258/g.108774  ORF Transcript_40258/g.108774 Transcript_40258/m.108774 type:complete len:474 (+) Transcript_40258:52-1473(+)